jgi:hypothetical protein
VETVGIAGIGGIEIVTATVDQRGNPGAIPPVTGTDGTDDDEGVMMLMILTLILIPIPDETRTMMMMLREAGNWGVMERIRMGIGRGGIGS